MSTIMSIIRFFYLGAFLVAIGLLMSCSDEDAEDDVEGAEVAGGSISIRWWGQSCFTLSVEDGSTVLTDPFMASMGFAAPSIEPQVVTISHEHPDHNAESNVSGDFETIRGTGEHTAAEMTFQGVATFHDDNQGADNTVFVWEMEGVHFAHLGDLGHVLTDEQVDEIGEVDVLMIPVAGGPTIDGPTAVQVAEQLMAKLIIPMHYRTDLGPSFLQGPEAFLEAVPDDWTIQELETSSLTVTSADFSDEEIRVALLDVE